MSFKYRKYIYETGSTSGTPQLSVEYEAETFNYVKVKANGQARYLRIENDKSEFTDLSNATPFSEKEALKRVKVYRECGIAATVFSCTKKADG